MEDQGVRSITDWANFLDNERRSHLDLFIEGT